MLADIIIVLVYSFFLTSLLVFAFSSLFILSTKMDLLLVVCGYSPIENHPTAHTPPHTGLSLPDIPNRTSSLVEEASTPSDVTDGERKDDEGGDSPGASGSDRNGDGDGDGGILRLRKKEKGVDFSEHHSAGSTSLKADTNTHISSYQAASKSQ